MLWSVVSYRAFRRTGHAHPRCWPAALDGKALRWDCGTVGADGSDGQPRRVLGTHEVLRLVVDLVAGYNAGISSPVSAATCLSKEVQMPHDQQRAVHTDVVV